MIVRKAIENKKYDVVVCGGGPAGFCAAIQCARTGMKTALIEKYGALGGAMTLGGISRPALFHAWGKQIIAGIGWELMTLMAKDNWAKLPQKIDKETPHPQMAVMANPLASTYYMDCMCLKEKLDLLLLQPVVDVCCSLDGGARKIDSILISTKSGPVEIEASMYIDCTGDGDIAAWAGMAYETGAQSDGELQPGTLSFYLGNFDLNAIDRDEVEKKYAQALETGELMPWDYWPKTAYPYGMFEERGANINHVAFNSADSASRSNAEIEGRKSVMRLINWMRSNIKGADRIIPVMSSPEVWPRESRRIKGIDYITGKDYIRSKKYGNSLCYSFYSIDMHTNDSRRPLKNIFLDEKVFPTIPMGAMIPENSSNLLVAGRCISGDRIAHSAYRIQATCMATGQCAGAIVSASLSSGSAPKHADVDAVKKILREHHAIVP